MSTIFEAAFKATSFKGGAGQESHLPDVLTPPCFACTGVACDVSIGSSNAIFKAKTFKALAAREPRFAGMLRLVKAWAGVFGLNDAAEGTFNSFALGLMVSRTCRHLPACRCKALQGRRAQDARWVATMLSNCITGLDLHIASFASCSGLPLSAHFAQEAGAIALHRLLCSTMLLLQPQKSCNAS